MQGGERVAQRDQGKLAAQSRGNDIVHSAEDGREMVVEDPADLAVTQPLRRGIDGNDHPAGNFSRPFAPIGVLPGLFENDLLPRDECVPPAPKPAAAPPPPAPPPPVAAKPPAPKTLAVSSTGLFDFDKAVLTDNARAQLDK